MNKMKSYHIFLSIDDFGTGYSSLNLLRSFPVDVLKIEGRARRPYYVAVATKQYYNALHHKQVNQEELKLAFNRNYTPGYLDGNADIISNYQAHILLGNFSDRACVPISANKNIARF